MSGWKELAGCRDLDQDLFATTPRDDKRRRRALAVCAHCPVIAECLDAALADPTGVYGRIAGGATTDQRAHIAAVRERSADRLSKPRVAAAYRDLWEGHTTDTADPARKAAARHVLQDQQAARSLGEHRVVAETVRCVGAELRAAVAEGDQDAVGQVLRGLPDAHRAALLVAFASELGTPQPLWRQ